MSTTQSFLLVLLAAAVAPLISAGARRAVPALVVPVVVVELLLGVLIGPQGLNVAEPDEVISFLSELGLGFLFFFAGYEIRIDRIRGVPVRLAVLGWLISCALAYSFAGILAAAGVVISGLLTGSALSTTALGTLIPVLRDVKRLDTPLGTHVLAAGAAGEFGPILVVTLLLGSESNPGTQALLLLAFVAVALLAGWLTTGAAGRSMAFLNRSLEGSGQLPVRLTVLLLFALVVIAHDLGLDVILGAFAAGFIMGLILKDVEAEHFESKLDAVGFGLLIPFFFVTSGMNLQIEALTSSVGAALKVPLFLTLMLVVRGAPAMLLYRQVLAQRDRMALALMSATALPLIVAITTIGIDTGEMRESTAAALVAAGVLSVLFFPAAALALLQRSEPDQ